MRGHPSRRALISGGVLALFGAAAIALALSVSLRPSAAQDPAKDRVVEQRDGPAPGLPSAAPMPPVDAASSEGAVEPLTLITGARYEQRPLVDLSPVAAAIVDGGVQRAAAVVLDLERGQAWVANGGIRFPLASIIKVPVLLAAVEHARTADGLPPEQLRNLDLMIRESDNEAANAVLEWMGGRDGLREVLAGLGIGPRRMALVQEWGESWIQAQDVAAIFDAIARPGVLDPAGRARALRLMMWVVPEQRWGVTAGLPSDLASRVALKNGWFPADHGPSFTHSAGIIPDAEGNRRYVMVIMTAGSQDLDAGVALVSTIAMWLNRGLTRR